MVGLVESTIAPAEDKISARTTDNAFRYVGNNPVNCVDPTGLEEEAGTLVKAGVPIDVKVDGIAGKLTITKEILAPAIVAATVDANGNKSQLRSPNNKLSVTIPAGEQPTDIAAFYGLHLNFKHVCEKEGVAYFVQYKKVTATKVLEGKRQTYGSKVDLPWGLDGAVKGGAYPNHYEHQQLGKKETWADDSPNQGYNLDQNKLKVKPEANNDITITATGDPAKGEFLDKDKVYKALAEQKWQLEMVLQTYLVSVKTKEPIGYFSWGFLVDQEAAAPTVTPFDMRWHDGVDKAVWQPIK